MGLSCRPGGLLCATSCSLVGYKEVQTSQAQADIRSRVKSLVRREAPCGAEQERTKIVVTHNVEQMPIVPTGIRNHADSLHPDDGDRPPPVFSPRRRSTRHGGDIGRVEPSRRRCSRCWALIDPGKSETRPPDLNVVQNVRSTSVKPFPKVS